MSSDEEVMRACVSTLVWHYANAPIDRRLLQVTELVGLKCLLSDERSHRLSALSRVSAVAAWVNASQQHRTNAFADLVALIDFDDMSREELADLPFDDDFAALPSSCKSVPRSAVPFSILSFTSRRSNFRRIRHSSN